MYDRHSLKWNILETFVWAQIRNVPRCWTRRQSSRRWRTDCRVSNGDCEPSNNRVRVSCDLRRMHKSTLMLSRTLSLAVWQIGLREEDWEICAEGPCKCIPEIKSVSCWRYDLPDLPPTQLVPADVLKLWAIQKLLYLWWKDIAAVRNGIVWEKITQSIENISILFQL